MIMGHELTHGFDNQGRKFDKFGNLDDWWENKSASAYEERAECMEKQYSAYKEEGLNVSMKDGGEGRWSGMDCRGWAANQQVVWF